MATITVLDVIGILILLVILIVLLSIYLLIYQFDAFFITSIVGIIIFTVLGINNISTKFTKEKKIAEINDQQVDLTKCPDFWSKTANGLCINKTHDNRILIGETSHSTVPDIVEKTIDLDEVNNETDRCGAYGKYAWSELFSLCN